MFSIIGGQEFIIKFKAVQLDFRVLESGILGRDFLRNNEIILNISQTKPAILPPRSNCILAVTTNAQSRYDQETGVK